MQNNQDSKILNRVEENFRFILRFKRENSRTVNIWDKLTASISNCDKERHFADLHNSIYRMRMSGKPAFLLANGRKIIILYIVTSNPASKIILMSDF